MGRNYLGGLYPRREAPGKKYLLGEKLLGRNYFLVATEIPLGSLYPGEKLLGRNYFLVAAEIPLGSLYPRGEAPGKKLLFSSYRNFFREFIS